VVVQGDEGTHEVEVARGGMGIIVAVTEGAVGGPRAHSARIPLETGENHLTGYTETGIFL
jgi:hypothetical protein